MKSKGRKSMKSNTTISLLNISKKMTSNIKLKKVILNKTAKVILIQKLIREGLGKQHADNYLFSAYENIMVKRQFNIFESIYEKYQKKLVTLITKGSGNKKSIATKDENVESKIEKKNGLTQVPQEVNNNFNADSKARQVVVRSAVVMRRMEYNNKLSQKNSKDPYKVLLIQRKWRRYYITEIMIRIKLIQSYFRRKKQKYLILLRQRLPEDASSKLERLIDIFKNKACREIIPKVIKNSRRSSKTLLYDKNLLKDSNCKRNSFIESPINTNTFYPFSNIQENKNSTSLNINNIPKSKIGEEVRSFIDSFSTQTFSFDICISKTNNSNIVNNNNKHNNCSNNDNDELNSLKNLIVNKLSKGIDNNTQTYEIINELSLGDSFTISSNNKVKLFKAYIERNFNIEHIQQLTKKKSELKMRNESIISIISNSSNPTNIITKPEWKEGDKEKNKQFDILKLGIYKEPNLTISLSNTEDLLKGLLIQKVIEFAIINSLQQISLTDDISIDSCTYNHFIYLNKNKVQRKVANNNWCYITNSHLSKHISLITTLQRKYRSHLVSKYNTLNKQLKDALLDNCKSKTKEYLTTSQTDHEPDNEQDISNLRFCTSIIITRNYYYDDRNEKIVAKEIITSTFPLNCSIDL